MAGYGLRPVKGPGTGYGTNTGGFNEYPVADDYAGNIFSGDFVELIANGTGSAAKHDCGRISRSR